MDPVFPTFLGLPFIFLMTSLGSSVVFLSGSEVNEIARTMMPGLAAGIMLSAALCSLLAPSIAEAKKQDLHFPAFAPCVVSFFFRCLLILLLDILIPLFLKRDQAGAIKKQPPISRAATHGVLYWLVAG
jgi:zinc transporter ZupT